MMTRRAVRWMLPVICILSVCSHGWAGLKGGCAKVNITPPLGLKLIGSAGKPSDAVLDELYGRALVLSDGQTTVAVVSADLLYVPAKEISGPVRAIVSEKTGIPPENVMLCATHTHSGPEVFGRAKLSPEVRVPAEEIDRAYLCTLVEKLAGAVRIAHRDMNDVAIGSAVGQLPEVLFNRRPRRPDGKVEMAFRLPPEITATSQIEKSLDGRTRVTFTMPQDKGPLEFGPIDPDVFVMRVEDPAGDIVASMVSFGCHPVCVYPFLPTTISADYPGRATNVVEGVEGGVCLFALGLAGNTVPIQRDVGPCDQIGRALGAEAVRRLQFLPTTGDVTLAARSCTLTLPTRDDPSQEIQTEIQVLRIGDIYLMGLPGEVLVEVGLAIKEWAGIEKLWITTVTNDIVGYVCHGAAYDEGGYECNRGTHLAKGAGEKIIDRALALLEEVKAPSPSASGF